MRPIKPECVDLINTCYANPASGTETLYCLGFDLDAHRADEQWKTKGGKLKWSQIKRMLAQEYPEVFRYVFAVVRSTSGKGLAIYVAISPLEMVSQTLRAQLAAKALQEKLLLLFNRHGLGADPGAIGLKRDFCNWRNAEKTIYLHTHLLSAIQADRTPVVKNLLAYLKPFGLAEYVKKSEREGLLYPDLRAERKLAKLYVHLLDETGCVQISRAEIRELTGLSLPFISQLLKNPPAWLLTEYYEFDGEWGLWLRPERALTERAAELVDNHDKGPEETKNFYGTLDRPETVTDGNRNHWITKACLLLKHNGITQEKALDLVQYHADTIPHDDDSWSCKHVKNIVASIYRNHRHLFGIGGAKIPSWLFHIGPRVQSQNTAPRRRVRALPLAEPSGRLGEVNNIKEGGVSPQRSVLRKVSGDQCFSFDRNYYSLPKAWVGENVLVFAWGTKLRVYNASGEKFIFAHERLACSKGKYQVHPPHLDPTHEDTQGDYYDYLVKRYERAAPGLAKFARRLINQHGLFALRKLWTLKGLVNRYGCEAVNDAAYSARNLRDLATRINATRTISHITGS